MESQLVYPCDLCQKYFSSTLYRDKHRQRHFDNNMQLAKKAESLGSPPPPIAVAIPPPIAVSIPPQTVAIKSSLVLSPHHPPSPPAPPVAITTPSQPTTKYECKSCGRSFVQKTQYQRHCKMHMKRLACAVCGDEFVQQSQLAHHVWEIHRKTLTELALVEKSLTQPQQQTSYAREIKKCDSRLELTNNNVKVNNSLSHSAVTKHKDINSDEAEFSVPIPEFNGCYKPRIHASRGAMFRKPPPEDRGTKSRVDVYDFDANEDDDVITPSRVIKPKFGSGLKKCAMADVALANGNGNCEPITDGSCAEVSAPAKDGDAGTKGDDEDYVEEDSQDERLSEENGEVCSDDQLEHSFAFVEKISPTGLKIKLKPLVKSPAQRKRKANFQSNLVPLEGLKLKIKKVGKVQSNFGTSVVKVASSEKSGNLNSESSPTNCQPEVGDKVRETTDNPNGLSIVCNALGDRSCVDTCEQAPARTPQKFRTTRANTSRSSKRLLLNLSNRNLVDPNRRVTRSRSATLSSSEQDPVLSEISNSNLSTRNVVATAELPVEKRERICLKISKSLLSPYREECEGASVDNGSHHDKVVEAEREPLKFSIPLSKLPAVYSTWKPLQKTRQVKSQLANHHQVKPGTSRTMQAAHKIRVHYKRLRRSQNLKSSKEKTVAGNLIQSQSCEPEEGKQSGLLVEEVMSECDSAVVDMVRTPESLQQHKVERAKEAHSEEDQGIGMDSDETNSPGAHSDSSLCGAQTKHATDLCSVGSGGSGMTSPNSVVDNHLSANGYADHNKWRNTFVSIPEGQNRQTTCSGDWPESPEAKPYSDCQEMEKPVSHLPADNGSVLNEVSDSLPCKNKSYEFESVSPPYDTMAELVSNVCSTVYGQDGSTHNSEYSKNHIADGADIVSDGRVTRQRYNSKNTAKDWLKSLDDHGRTKTKCNAMSSPKAEQPLINMWQAPSSVRTGSQRNGSGSSVFSGNVNGDRAHDTFGAFATKTNNFQSFADLNPANTGLFNRDDSESDFEDFEPPALKVPVKTLQRIASEKRTTSVSHSDFLQTIGLQRQVSRTSVTDHYENEFLKFLNKQNGNEEDNYSDVFEEEDDGTSSDGEMDVGQMGNNCTCARFLTYFNKHQFVALSEELLYLRHKVCEMIVGLFPNIMYSGPFNIMSSDVEDLLDAISDVSNSSVSDSTPLSSGQSKYLKVNLCKTPKRCLLLLRKKAADFLQVLFPSTTLDSQVYHDTNCLQSIMEEIIANNKMEYEVHTGCDAF